MRRSGKLAFLGAIACVLCCTLLVVPVAVHAHESRPIVIEVDQSEGTGVGVRFKAPATVDPRFIPTLQLPEICTQSDKTTLVSSNDAFLYQLNYLCSQSLSGQVVGLQFPVVNPSLSSLIVLNLSNGETFTKLLPPGETRWHVPTESSFSSVAGDYTRLGITHIWRGIDHLLFILCLLFIAGTKWRILAAITGFTLAHSLTLALSTLGYFKVSVAAVEAIIAMSIVFLAAEIVRNNRQSLVWRKPVFVAAFFGLLHGLGFASALADFGLPQLYQIHALAFFNIGVELGQLLFIGCILLAAGLLRRVSPLFVEMRTTMAAKFGSAYTIGITGSYWFLERSASALT